MRQYNSPDAHVSQEHLHSEQLAWGNSAGVMTQSASHAAAGILVPFQLASAVAASDFGAALQISAGGLGNYFIDLDEIFVTISQRVDETYLIEVYVGSGLFAASTRISSCYYRAAANNQESGPFRRKSRRFLGTLNVWARCACTFAGASTIDILFHGHKYDTTTRLGDEVLT